MLYEKIECIVYFLNVEAIYLTRMDFFFRCISAVLSGPILLNVP
jgi:hypothetical protein